MNNRILVCFLAFLSLFVVSCKDSDRASIKMIDDVEYGAVLRTIEASSQKININNPADFTLEIEAQDSQDGKLLDKVEFYVGFVDGSAIINGVTTRDDIKLKTVSASEFSDGKGAGEWGLPRYKTTFTFAEMTGPSGLNLAASDIFGGDSLVLKMKYFTTDRRSFDSSNVTGSMTGSFFKAPYKYNLKFVCIPTTPVPGVYTVSGQDSWGDGWNQGYLEINIDGSITKIGTNADFFAANSFESFTKSFTVPEGATVFTVSWVEGNWDSEVSYQIQGPDGLQSISETEPSAGIKTLSVCPVSSSTSVVPVKPVAIYKELDSNLSDQAKQAILDRKLVEKQALFPNQNKKSTAKSTHIE